MRGLKVGLCHNRAHLWASMALKGTILQARELQPVRQPSMSTTSSGNTT